MFSGWGNAGRGANTQKEEDMSLMTILNTKELRVGLALLVCLAADNMRRNLLGNFELSTPVSSARAGTDTLLDIDDRMKDERARIAQNRRRKDAELSTPKMQQFQKDALDHFDAWRMKILRRVGEVLSVRSEEVRIARRSASAEAETAARARREAQFLTWAQGDDAVDDEQKGSEAEFAFRIRSIPTSLSKLDEPKRVLVLHCVLLLVLSLEHYHAYSRVLLQYLAKSFRLSESVLSERESSVARGLLDSAASQMSAEEAKQKQANDGALSRKWKVGLATVGGAVLIGVTGGLAAPILAGAIGGLMGSLGLGALATLLGPLATNFFLIGGLFGAYGGKMTGGIVEKYAKEVEEFQFIPLSDHDQYSLPQDQSTPIIQAKRSHHLRLTIAISGFLTSPSDVTQPWLALNPLTTEPFALRYETPALTRLGENLATLIQTFAVDTLTWEVLRATLLSSIAAGLMPIGLIRTANMLDSPWSVAKARSEKAGRVLARALIDRVQGERPVCLVGFSLGARVVWAALQSLAEHGAFGLVESVVFMGAPVPADEAAWRRVRAVVSGRVVNAYSGDDWILGLVYRAGALQWGVAGLQRVKGVDGVENVDLGGAVDGHTSYKDIVGQVLQRIGWEDVDAEAVEREVQAQRGRRKEEDAAGPTSAKKKVDVETMVQAEDSEHGIVMADNTKPLLDIDIAENTTPGWERSPEPFSSSSRPQPSTASSNDLLSSILDEDNPEQISQSIKNHPPPPALSLPIRPTPISSERPEPKLLRNPEPKTMIPLEPARVHSPPSWRPQTTPLSTSASSPKPSQPALSRTIQPTLTSSHTPIPTTSIAPPLSTQPPKSPSPPPVRTPSPEPDDSDYDTESSNGELQALAPEPEMDGDGPERVLFGGTGGLDLTWEGTGLR